MLDSPEVSGTETSLPGTETLGSDGKAVKTKKQDEVTVEWGELRAENIESVCKFFMRNPLLCITWSLSI